MGVRGWLEWWDGARAPWSSGRPVSGPAPQPPPPSISTPLLPTTQRAASIAMEASNNQQQKEKEPRIHRPYAFDKVLYPDKQTWRSSNATKIHNVEPTWIFLSRNNRSSRWSLLAQMEGLVREMQDPESGVPVRSQKQFLTSIPSAFMGECHRYLRCGVSVTGHHGQDTTVGCLRVAGYDLIEWLMERLAIEESGTGSYVSTTAVIVSAVAHPPPCPPLYLSVYLARSLVRSSRRSQHAQPQPLLPEDTLTTNTIDTLASPFPIRICIDTFRLVPFKYRLHINTYYTGDTLPFYIESNMNYLPKIYNDYLTGGESFFRDGLNISRGFSGFFRGRRFLRATIRPRASEECKFRQIIESRFGARACNSRVNLARINVLLAHSVR